MINFSMKNSEFITWKTYEPYDYNINLYKLYKFNRVRKLDEQWILGIFLLVNIARAATSWLARNKEVIENAHKSLLFQMSIKIDDY